MTDHFALLNEPRRPWIDPDALKEKFIGLSGQFHPDRFYQASETERASAAEEFVAMVTAYNCLRETKNRLRHLIELELGAKPADIQRVPEEMMNVMFEVGALCREADAFLAERGKVTSPLLKVQWFERGHDWTEKLNARQQIIRARREELDRELVAMNPAWESANATGDRSPLPLARLDEIYRLLGYLGRWSEQLQERVVQLSF